jgi:hypothetical protein
VVVCFVDIGGIGDHHCTEVVVSFVDIGGIFDHHCIEVVVSFVISTKLTTTSIQ